MERKKSCWTLFDDEEEDDFVPRGRPIVHTQHIIVALLFSPPFVQRVLLYTTLGSQSAEKGRRRHGIDGKKKKKTKKTNLFFDEEDDDEEKDHHHQKEEGSSSWASRGHNKRSPGVASLLSRRFCGLRLLGGLCGPDETRR